jgi:uncharacterized protein (DUF433 family)
MGDRVGGSPPVFQVRGGMSVEFPRITVESNKMGGVPCVRGLRMPVATVVTMIAQGMSHEQILREHPALVEEDLQECLFYAAEALRERTIPLTATG